ncbi:DNA gyrase inhibitor YacG [Pseudoroseicyclus tamaricis]|uniref:DNA gyrase inhibitor YacG n=1 Tax=Pseudoroseicyclus tamaricis TaxID=2705421 RepID=A0A6B2JV28_9RHOB|nr:DNA gyrase inhibitor YacG [Pseudoroseicyclus tamaricis]NDV01745.1 DNA gyrase inhibitor YacG [Pseudoroseicyclus tamaricis]
MACPICGKKTDPDHRPFCSDRCREIDLGRWLKGTYRVPTQETPTDEDED